MREFIAKIIDPPAFAGAGDDKRRREALAKAEQILAMEFTFDDLPADLQGAVSAVETELTAASLLTIAASANLPDLASEIDGSPVYSALVKPLDGGGFYLEILLDVDEAMGGRPSWVGSKMIGDEAQRVAAQLEVAAAGGGSA